MINYIKNLSKILSVLVLSLLLSGCSNIVAVYKLNETARELMDNNDYKTAIARLESSYELDFRNYQTRYMLTCAYLRELECAKALEHALYIADAKPKEPSVYLLKGDAYTCVAKDVYENNLINKETREIEIKTQPFLKRYLHNLEKANEAYDKYYDLMHGADNSIEVLDKIRENNENITKMEAYLIE